MIGELVPSSRFTSLVSLAQTRDKRALHTGVGSGFDRNSAIMRSMSANRLPAIATSAIWTDIRQIPAKLTEYISYFLASDKLRPAPRCRLRAQEIPETVGERMKLNANRVGGE